MTREEAKEILTHNWTRVDNPNYSESELDEAFFMAIEALSADAERGYTEWLEKIIVDNEGANEWLCEDTPDLGWCEKNCHYSSIQAECLRHLYAISKGGDSE